MGFEEGEGKAGGDDSVDPGELEVEGAGSRESGENAEGGLLRGGGFTEDLVDESAKGGKGGEDGGGERSVEGNG
ncbi:MAG TPA: hypothetical protein VGV89_03435 [Thermoplasmata archaeon]|nr:hypothetical protein [Thermoplasmata archaeon]